MAIIEVVQASIESSLPWQVVGAWLPCLETGLAGAVRFGGYAFAAALTTEVTALRRSLAQHLRNPSR